MSTAAAVRLSNVRKSYGSHVAVDDLDLEVPEGSIYGFVGPNGSGKTTTIRMILHILPPESGAVEVLGKTGVRAANDVIGYLPEERGLYKKMKVGRLLDYYGAMKGMPKAQIAPAIDHWLERLDLTDWKKKRVDTLSKGMAQKVQFISSVIAGPKLLILDEPFSGLDPVNQEILREEILALRASGTTVIFSTHDMSTAEKMCDYVFMICRGHKVLDGTLDSIKAQYGQDTLRVRLEGGANGTQIEALQNVESVRDFGRYQEVRYHGDADAILERLRELARIELFEIVQPSLHDIFVRIAGPAAEKEAAESS